MVWSRQPRVHFGRKHLFDNYYDSSVSTAYIALGTGDRVNSEGSTG